MLFFQCLQNVWLPQCWRSASPYPLLHFWKRSPSYPIQQFKYLTLQSPEVHHPGPSLSDIWLSICCPQELSYAGLFQSLCVRALVFLLPPCHFLLQQELLAYTGTFSSGANPLKTQTRNRAEVGCWPEAQLVAETWKCVWRSGMHVRAAIRITSGHDDEWSCIWVLGITTWGKITLVVLLTTALYCIQLMVKIHDSHCYFLTYRFTLICSWLLYRYHCPVPKIFYVQLTVGNSEFFGEGKTRQAARHNAAMKALQALQNEPIPEKLPQVCVSESVLFPIFTLRYQVQQST